MERKRIEIVIDKMGGVSAETHGYTGHSCVEAMDSIMSSFGGMVEVKDEYHMSGTEVEQHIENNN